jgi:AraC family transcriptional regulator
MHGRSVPGNLMLMSAGQDSTWHCSNAMDELLLFLDPAVVTEVGHEAGVAGASLVDGVGLVSPPLQVLTSQLLRELEEPALGTRLFADTLTRAIALELVRWHSTARVPRSPHGVEMSARQLRAATEFIDAHIDQDLSLDKIAACAAMSPFRFSRGFRKATGQSPWRYVIVRRIERAKDLLRGSNHDLMEVAALTGFSTQSHFTDAFRRLCGTTPKRYRDGMRHRAG